MKFEDLKIVLIKKWSGDIVMLVDKWGEKVSRRIDSKKNFVDRRCVVYSLGIQQKKVTPVYGMRKTP